MSDQHRGARANLKNEMDELQASYDRLHRSAADVRANPGSSVQLLNEVAIRLSQLRKEIDELQSVLEMLRR